MAPSLAVRLRRLWLDVHLWIGAGLLVLLVPLSVSGSVLVWHDPLDRALHAERYAVSGQEVRLPVQAYARAAQGAFQGQATITQLRLPERPGDPVVAVGRIKGQAGPGGRPRNLNAWIDPPTGRVLGVADISRDESMWVHRLHGTLLIPQVGRKVVGWLGWAMFVSCATGLWLWWPRNGAFLKGLRWRRGPSPLFNLHHMLGFWVCLPLAVLSLTGVYISFPQTSRALFGVKPPEAAGARPGGGQGRFAPPLPQPELTLEQALAAAQAQAPGARVTSVSWPTRGQEPAWRVQLRGPGGPQALQVADATGLARADRSAQGSGAADPVSRWMRKVHDGAGTGIVWQAVIFAGGIIPAILAFSGVVMWLRRRARKRAMAERLAQA